MRCCFGCGLASRPHITALTIARSHAVTRSVTTRMTVDAVVNLFIQHAKNAQSPLTSLQNEPDSQRQDNSSHAPNPLPLADDNNPPIPTQEHIADQSTSQNDHDCAHLASPAEKLLVDLDVLSPPPLPSTALSEHAECALCGTMGTPRTCGTLVGVRLGDRDAAVHHACALWAPQVYQPQAR